MPRRLLLALVLLALLPATAAAQEIGAAATGLGQGPLHVDPSLRSALTDQERTDLAARLANTKPPVLVALVPLVSGDSVDGKPRQLLTVLRRRTGRDDAAIVTVHDNILYADTPTPTAEEDPVRAAATVALLAEDREYDERIATTLNRFLDALADPDVFKEAEALRDRQDQDSAPSRPATSGGTERADDDGDGVGLAPFISLAIIVVVGLLVLTLRRRRGARPGSGPLVLPDHVFEAAHGARRRELRQTVERELTDLADQLDAEPVPREARAQEQYQRALDARDTAGRLLADEDATDADLVGALVLEDLAQTALGHARALTHGRPITDPAPLCALNPTHGRSVDTGRWGASPKLPVCKACRRDLRAKHAPDVLDDGGRPYLERDTVWARTAFGALVSDLPTEVVRDRVERE
ncbi:hypothetical protein OJ997_21170 [Solirubrobacter phytolaccae]|uniref:TPM domain-containing protein n=1 Tax=Solirubrobacter phytolaccae TaxID=1404360 RepID=A0A9X3SGX9_9ACTN|nr:hypothetical protein [Solirubrobacter phytolaccae]MDA0182837.1 hypothetical protein [Solirubrobacter phytolaccae]